MRRPGSRAQYKHFSELLADERYLRGRKRILDRLWHGEIDPAEATRLCSAFASTFLTGFSSGGRWVNVVAVYTSSGSYTVQPGYDKNNNTIEGIGGGSAAAQGLTGTTGGAADGGGGGSGGAYARLVNFDPGGSSSISYTIGAGGSGSNGAPGGNTTWNTSSMIAVGATAQASPGLASNCTPTANAQSGGGNGLGGASPANQGGGGGGGGGAGGPSGGGGTGGNAGTPTAGTSGAAGAGSLGGGATVGAGGGGGVGGEEDLNGSGGSVGGNYGGGGGGGGGGGHAISAGTRPGGARGNGAPGVIVHTYRYFQ